ncbi:MAG: hypothetical protein K6G66_10640, partial [Oscillospiraceae bacterium]|nr:hypothetical protein [Oscillospiraceae bacterium]
GIFRKNCALILSLFLEIHRVFLRKTAFIRTQFFSKSALAELCGIALIDKIEKEMQYEKNTCTGDGACPSCRDVSGGRGG